MPSGSPPVAVNDSFTVHQAGQLADNVLDNDTDAESDSLTATLVADVSHGSLSLGSDGFFTYFPATGFTGTDTFTYKANDGTSDSNVAAVTISVTDTSPAAVNDSFSVHQGWQLAGNVLGNDTDGEGDTLTASVVNGTSHGTLSLGSDGSFTYFPATGYTGADSFSYKANDGALDSNVAAVTINVTDAAPVVANHAYSADEFGQAVGSLLDSASDPDGDGLLAAVVSGPATARCRSIATDRLPTRPMMATRASTRSPTTPTMVPWTVTQPWSPSA